MRGGGGERPRSGTDHSDKAVPLCGVGKPPARTRAVLKVGLGSSNAVWDGACVVGTRHSQ